MDEIEEIKERRKLSYDGLIYSIRRIDLQVVSISGAGIYICLETIKYLKENNLESNLAIKASGLLLLLAIIANLVSQIAGRLSNKYDYLMCLTKIEVNNKPNKEEKKEIKKYDDLSEKYESGTNILTNASVLLMLFGVVLIVIFFLFIF